MTFDRMILTGVLIIGLSMFLTGVALTLLNPTKSAEHYRGTQYELISLDGRPYLLDHKSKTAMRLVSDESR